MITTLKPEEETTTRDDLDVWLRQERKKALYTGGRVLRYSVRGTQEKDPQAGRWGEASPPRGFFHFPILSHENL